MSAAPSGDAEDELELLRTFRAGDAEAARRFDACYRALLERLCRGYLGNAADAEDATQEILRRALASSELPERPRLWLLTVARNHCLNELRTRRRRPGEGAPVEELELAAKMTGPVTAALRAEREVALHAALARLSPQERELLRLRYVDELARDDIAVLVGLSVGVVKSRLHEALTKLRGLAP